MAVATNEPYRRVSKDNGVFDGALIGAAVGAGGAGAGIFGARLNYNAIDKRAEAKVTVLDDKIDRASSSKEKLVQKGGRVSPVDSVKQFLGQRQINDINAVRESKLNHLDEKNSMARKYINNIEDTHVRNQADMARRSSFANASTDVNAKFDQMVNGSKGNTWVNDVEEKRQRNLNKNMKKKQDRLDSLQNERTSWTGEGLQKRKSSHAYSKMGGGWRKAGIIGATAVVGGGIGMIADGIQK